MIKRQCGGKYGEQKGVKRFLVRGVLIVTLAVGVFFLHQPAALSGPRDCTVTTHLDDGAAFNQIRLRDVISNALNTTYCTTNEPPEAFDIYLKRVEIPATVGTLLLDSPIVLTGGLKNYEVNAQGNTQQKYPYQRLEITSQNGSLISIKPTAKFVDLVEQGQASCAIVINLEKMADYGYVVSATVRHLSFEGFPVPAICVDSPRNIIEDNNFEYSSGLVLGSGWGKGAIELDTGAIYNYGAINTVRDNTFHGYDFGVRIGNDSSYNLISKNDYDVLMKPIFLGGSINIPLLNDENDADTGPNKLLNYPDNIQVYPLENLLNPTAWEISFDINQSKVEWIEVYVRKKNLGGSWEFSSVIGTYPGAIDFADFNVVPTKKTVSKHNDVQLEIGDEICLMAFDKDNNTSECSEFHVLDKDSDEDGLIDSCEVKVGTKLSDPDTDGDGMLDGEEDANHNCQWDAGETDVFKADNPFNLGNDSDFDGLTDYQEKNVYSTKVMNPDTDGDGLNDRLEVLNFKTAPHKQDTDKDRISDYCETMLTGTDPTEADTDGDGNDDGKELGITVEFSYTIPGSAEEMSFETETAGIKTTITETVNYSPGIVNIPCDELNNNNPKTNPLVPDADVAGDFFFPFVDFTLPGFEMATSLICFGALHMEFDPDKKMCVCEDGYTYNLAAGKCEVVGTTEPPIQPPDVFGGGVQTLDDDLIIGGLSGEGGGCDCSLIGSSPSASTWLTLVLFIGVLCVPLVWRYRCQEARVRSKRKQ